MVEYSHSFQEQSIKLARMPKYRRSSLLVSLTRCLHRSSIASPPLARGNHAGKSRTQHPSGPIPARAGKPIILPDSAS